MLIRALNGIVVGGKNGRVMYQKGESFELDVSEAKRLIDHKSAEEITDYVVLHEERDMEVYGEEQLLKMTKAQIVAYAEGFDLTVDEALTKDVLIATVLNAIEESDLPEV